MRAITMIAAICVILGAFFGLSAAAYGLGGLLDDKLYAGAHHFAVIATMMLVGVMVTATLFTLAERKWSGLMQNRIGPNRARIALPFLKDKALFGLPHIPADVVKMLTKEAFKPEVANGFLFKLGPILSFAPVFALFAVVPAGPTLPVMGHQVMLVSANPDFGVLYLFAIASLAVYGTTLAGWASNNKFALLGGVRAASQMVSYEVALGLGLVGAMMAYSTVQLAGPTGMVEAQQAYLWSFHLGSFDVGLPAWGFFTQPLGFFLFFAAAFAETKRAPFDTPEGESEILGYFVEYSGMQFGMFMISEFVEIVVLSGVLAAAFFGGYGLPFGNEWLRSVALFQEQPWLLGAFYGMVFWAKVILLCYLQLAIRWTFPRFRYDQVQHIGWKILLPLGIVNVFATGALVLWDPSLKLLTLVGLAELVALAFLTVTAPGQVRRQQEHDEAAHGDGHGGGHGGGHDAHDTHAPALTAGGH